MSAVRITLLITLLVFSIASCSVIPEEIRREAEPPVPFKTLVQEADKYVGKTVVLGGYVLETKDEYQQTTIEVLQAPLTARYGPRSKEHSQGSFVVSYKGPLRSDIYSPNCKVTVAGKVVGYAVENFETCPHPCLKIESRNIHVWAKHDYVSGTSPYEPYGWDSPWPTRW